MVHHDTHRPVKIHFSLSAQLQLGAAPSQATHCLFHTLSSLELMADQRERRKSATAVKAEEGELELVKSGELAPDSVQANGLNQITVVDRASGRLYEYTRLDGLKISVDEVS